MSADPTWTAPYLRPNASTQKSSAYKSGIDANCRVMERVLGWFAAHQQTAGSPTPDMSVRLRPGFIWNPEGPTLTELEAQTVSGFTTPSAGNERIDRVVVDEVTGVATRVAGTESASPSAPAIPGGKLPICSVLLTDSDTSIVNSMITDERALKGPYAIDGVDLDGTNDIVTRGGTLDGAADGKVGTVSLWVRLDAGTGLQTIMSGGIAERFELQRLTSSGALRLDGARASDGANILRLTSATSYAASATWLHILASWDLAAGLAHMYVNDVDDLAGGSTLTDASIDYTNSGFILGDNPANTARYSGCLAECYVNEAEYIDLSVTANRRKFITASGKPAALGSDGSLPTGTAPIVYQRLTKGAAASEFVTNRGTGGGMTEIGALEVASTSPSDP